MDNKAMFISLSIVGISAGLISGLVVDIVSDHVPLPDLLRLLVPVPVSLVLVALLGIPLVSFLNRLTHALTQVNAGATAEPVVALPFGILSTLHTEANRLIKRQREFQMARGHLYEQISAVAAEEERKRLARDLHDSIKQQVFSISVSAAAAHAHLDNNLDAARTALIDVKQSAQEAMVEMRALLQQLAPAPLEKAGLIEALREQCEALGYRTGAVVHTHFGPLPRDEQFPTGTQTVIFRIAQEALSNIARHARAQRVDLRLYVPDDEAHVMLEIEDEGQGFDATQDPSGMGLSNMRSRAQSINADFVLNSQPNEGTKIRLTIPTIQPQQEKINMFDQLEPQRKALVVQYWTYAGVASALIVALSLFLWRAINRSENFFESAIVTAILGVLVLIIVTAPPALVVIGRRAHRATSDLVRDSGEDHQLVSWFRRHRQVMALVIAVVAAMSIPQLTVHPRFSALMPLWVGLFFGVVGLWHYIQSFRLYRVEVRVMPPAERATELEGQIGKLNTNWTSLGGLSVIMLIILTTGDGLSFPPADSDQWVNFGFSALTVVFFANQLISLAVYRNWRERALSEAATV